MERDISQAKSRLQELIDNQEACNKEIGQLREKGMLSSAAQKMDDYEHRKTRINELRDQISYLEKELYDYRQCLD